jgi:hypothetical protein
MLKISILRALFWRLKRKAGLKRLRIRGRAKLPVSAFLIAEKLYHGFAEDDIDPDTEKPKIASIRFPDFSCNWARFSEPEDVRVRPNAERTDGCYSITVEVARYQKFANPVHHPIVDHAYENYAHVEVRELRPDEDFTFEPPRNRRKIKSAITNHMRLEYRQNLVNQLVIEFPVS